jgi:glycosyltransferase involved in cell wall biosynthesis
MRIGHVIGQLSAGGAEGQLRLLASAESRRSTPFVYCLSPHPTPHGRALERSGVPVRTVGGGRLARISRLRDWMAEDRVNIVHSWLYIGNAYAWAANGGRRPLITSARNCKRQGISLDFLNRRAFAVSDAIVANSNLVDEYIQREYGAPADRIRVVYNGIDLDRFCRRVRGIPPERPTIVAVGRVVRQKNPELFVRAARRLLRELPDARFRWIGDGGMREGIVRDLATTGLAEEVRFEGERGDIERVLDEADLFWLTSDWEGLPNVVMEAMASGLPVVATDVGGTSELFRSGREGQLVRAGDAVALVEASRRLLADAPVYAAASRAALASAGEFSVETMVKSMEQLYDDVTAGLQTW